MSEDKFEDVVTNTVGRWFGVLSRKKAKARMGLKPRLSRKDNSATPEKEKDANKKVNIGGKGERGMDLNENAPMWPQESCLCVNPDCEERGTIIGIDAELVAEAAAREDVPEGTVDDGVTCTTCKEKTMVATPWLWAFFEDPEGNKASHFVNTYVIFLILSGAVITVVETIPGVHNTNDTAFFAIETFYVVNFSLEFVLRLAACPDRHHFWTNFMNWVDIISITPYYLELALSNVGINLQVLRILRTARALRMVKVGRYSSGIRLIQNSLAASLDALQLFAFIFIVLVIVLASAVYYTERGDYDKTTELYERTSIITQEKEISPFQSIPGSFWWTIVTLVTVGYGDMQPVTLPGYVVGIIAQLAGVIMLALPLSIIGANFHEERERMKEERAEEQGDVEDRGALEAADNVVDTGERYVNDLNKLVIFLTETLVATADLTDSSGNVISPDTELVSAPSQQPQDAASDGAGSNVDVPNNTKINQVAAAPDEDDPPDSASLPGVSVSMSAQPALLPPLQATGAEKADISPRDAPLSLPSASSPCASDVEHRRVPSSTVTMCEDKLEDMLLTFKTMHEELQ